MPENPAPFAEDVRRVENVRCVHKILLEQFGTRTPKPHDPLDGLILIILSQATNDQNCDRAFSGLKAAFPCWHKALEAPVEKIADAIRCGGLANQKAARIQALLREIYQQRGDFDLSFLHEQSAEQCEAFLSRFHGVGPKTVACVLVFFLGKPAFPVDTHVFRVVKRLGWIRPRASPEEAHRVLKTLVPDECKLDLHINFIAHGRLTCRANGVGGPRCGECTIRSFCAFGRDLSVQPSPPPAISPQNDFFVTIKARRE